MIKLGVPYSELNTQLDIVNTREDEAVAFAAGVELAGKESYIYIQDDGLLNCLNAFTTLLIPYNIPIFISVYSRKDNLEHHKVATELAGKLCQILGQKTLSTAFFNL